MQKNLLYYLLALQVLNYQGPMDLKWKSTTVCYHRPELGM